MKTIIPTGPFTKLEPQNQENGKFYIVHKRRATDFEDPKLRTGRSGSAIHILVIANQIADRN